MRYSITFVEDDFEQLRRVLARSSGVENAAYLLCRQGRTEKETRLLVREVIPLEPEHVLEASPAHMKIGSASFRRAMKRADQEKCCFVFVHTHPDGHPSHSQQDDCEEAPLFRTAYNRIHTEAVHASL